MEIQELGKYNIIIDFNDLFTKSITNLYYKEGEVGTAFVKAKLVKKYTSIDLTDCRVILNIVTPKGESIVDTATIIDEKEGIVEIKLEPVALSTGISFFELTIVDSQYHTKKSPRYAYRVLDSLSEDTIIASEKYPILVNLIRTVDDLQKETQSLHDQTVALNQEVRDLNDTMTESERIRNENEEQRKSNEIIRQENESARLENMTRFEKEFVDFKEGVGSDIETFKEVTNLTVSLFKSEVAESIDNSKKNIEEFKTNVNNTVLALPKIDDINQSETNTYSSKKIQEELDKKSVFNGDYNSLINIPETFLATKIIFSDGENLELKTTKLSEQVASLIKRIEKLEESHSSEVNK